MEITMTNTIVHAPFKTIKLILRLLLAKKEFINRQLFSESRAVHDQQLFTCV